MGFFIGSRASRSGAGAQEKGRREEQRNPQNRPEPSGRRVHLPAFSYFFLNRSTRPAVSTSFCFPV